MLGSDTLELGRAAPTSFECFPNLPTELRLKIWEEAVRQVDHTRRVVHLFVKCLKPPVSQSQMRLSLLNSDYLLKTDSITRLVITNTESRHVALRYLAEHPLRENPFPEHDPLRGDPLQTVIQRWKSKHSSWATSHVRLFEHLYKLGVDPTRDALFLNGMDIKPEAVD